MSHYFFFYHIVKLSCLSLTFNQILSHKSPVCFQNSNLLTTHFVILSRHFFFVPEIRNFRLQLWSFKRNTVFTGCCGNKDSKSRVCSLVDMWQVCFSKVSLLNVVAQIFVCFLKRCGGWKLTLGLGFLAGACLQ